MMLWSTSNQSHIHAEFEDISNQKNASENITDIVLFLCAIAWFYLVMVTYYPKPRCNCATMLLEKVVLITGGSDGVGKETAFELAKRGAKIIITCRDIRKGHMVALDITEQTGNGNVTVIYADFEKLETVKRCTELVHKNFDKIDILINNAGIGHGVGSTHDGFPKLFGVNHLGSYLLTTQLLPLLRKSQLSRVIFVSSIAHQWGEIDFETLNQPDEGWIHSQFRAYARSKLANVLFARELDRREKSISTFVAHPGWTFTSLFREFPVLVKLITFPLFHIFLYRPRVGAQTQIHLALSPDLDHFSGSYFVSCRPSKTSTQAHDCQLAADLWSYSEQMVAPFQTLRPKSCVSF